MDQQLPYTKITVRRVYMQDKQEINSEILEGEVPMSQEQQDQYKAVIGDGLGRVAIGRDMSEMDFGSGGKVFVSVSLVCDQSYGGLTQAVNLASQLAGYYVEQHLQEVRQRCVQLGLLKPAVDPNLRPQY